MGYSTRFSGVLSLSRKLILKEARAILEFNDEPSKIENPPVRGYMQWVPTETLDGIMWDQGEKFYDYIEWLTWLCDLLKTWGISVSGRLIWAGEDTDDVGEITVSDNVVSSIQHARQTIGSTEPLTMKRLAEIALDQGTKE
ncbi:hypothetical protein [Chitinasiproducens palmae]|uniref:Uncharacterized protein n=1 Tax=Chitinasiproducens palmae TaxID=1770053 RepID=A0A1H2PST2_9BURK|nr:hypothetical protein [Chitinasiproducens palmae]SDV49238.1 hypothetical protein SAMN05216551_107174 [Chitinasiproducens palmae]